jgi:hypothetical protein
MPSRAKFSLIVIAVLGWSQPMHAQQTVKLSTVIAAFLADSGVRTRGLDWTSGSALPVKWQSARPVPAADWLKQQGYTLSRTGTANITVGDMPAMEMEVGLWGNAAGLQKSYVSFTLNEMTMDLVEQALVKDGFTLQPLKCERAKEGASYGNAVYVAKAPGKTASGFHESWNCAHDGCTGMLTLLYRKADVAAVECNGA